MTEKYLSFSGKAKAVLTERLKQKLLRKTTKKLYDELAKHDFFNDEEINHPLHWGYFKQYAEPVLRELMNEVIND